MIRSIVLTLSLTAITLPAVAGNGYFFKNYFVPEIATAFLKDYLREKGNLFHTIDAESMAETMAGYCNARSQGMSREGFSYPILMRALKESEETRNAIAQYNGSMMATAEQFVCLEHRSR